MLDAKLIEKHLQDLPISFRRSLVSWSSEKQNSKCCHQLRKRGRLKVHLGPRVGFGGLMSNN
jgi:hypothetical protein